MAQRYLHGLNDIGGEHLHGNRPGWTLINVEIGLNMHPSGNDYTPLGVGILARLNHGYGSSGTIPEPQHYGEFAAACAAWAEKAWGVDYYIIGNEPNHEGERPNGHMIEPEDYARCFCLCRDAIKQAKPGAKVLVAAIAPYRNDPKWTEYLHRVLVYVEAHGGCDGVTIHAYTRSMAPEAIKSTAMMGEPLQDTYSGFFTYIDAMEEIPASMDGLACFITEFDAYLDWLDQDTGVITAMYDEVDDWNQGSHNFPKIKGALCFRWLGPPEAENTYDWEMRNKPNLLNDFRRAVEHGFMAPAGDVPAIPVGPGNVIVLPYIPNEEPTVTINRDIDPRLYARGTVIEPVSPSGSGDVWDLTYAKFFNKQESGGRHHLYVEFVGEAGQGLVGVPFVVHDPNGDKPRESNGRSGFDATNEPFWANGLTVWVTVNNGDTVRNLGMGDSTPEGFNKGEHTATVLRYTKRPKWVAPIAVTPPPPVVEPSRIQLAHPVVDPKYRMVTQGFGERPSYYGQFKIDEVPLRGHEGIDFATPVRSLIQAVDDGTITEVGDQGKVGYGRWIKLVTAWGEAVYAHLEEQWVKIGDQVRKGQHIGLTGATGNVDGAHLHFGMRVKPFNRQDGWGGYVDSLPYLDTHAVSQGPTLTPKPSPEKRELVEIVKAASSEFKVDWRLIVSLIHAESSFNPLSKNSKSGAAGLGNIMPLTWGEWAPKVGAQDIFNPKDNARVTAAYLAWCMNLVEGDPRRGLWCYNWSPRDVPKGLTPPPETLAYASKVIHGAEVLAIVGG